MSESFEVALSNFLFRETTFVGLISVSVLMSVFLRMNINYPLTIELLG